MPGRKAFRQPVQFRDGPPVHIQRVRGGKLRDANADCVVPVEVQVRAVVLGAQFGAADILQPDQRAVVRWSSE